jgi:hypothetical protein
VEIDCPSCNCGTKVKLDKKTACHNCGQGMTLHHRNKPKTVVHSAKKTILVKNSDIRMEVTCPNCHGRTKVVLGQRTPCEHCDQGLTLTRRPKPVPVVQEEPSAPWYYGYCHQMTLFVLLSLVLGIFYIAFPSVNVFNGGMRSVGWAFWMLAVVVDFLYFAGLIQIFIDATKRLRSITIHPHLLGIT